MAHTLQVGSRKSDLHAIALKVVDMAVQYQICLEPERIPRELNVRADLLSRVVDLDDWYLNPAVFNWLDYLWGPQQRTDSMITITVNWFVLIVGAGAQVLRQWMHSLWIRVQKTTGGALQ